MKKLMRRAFYSLAICLPFFFASLLNAADVQTYSVSKGIYYSQTGSGSPLAETNNGYAFNAEVQLEDDGLATGGQVHVPGGEVKTLTLDKDVLEYKKKNNTAAKLATDFPDGLYSLTINTLHDGTKTPQLNLVGGSFPNPPHISNYQEAQAVNPNGWFVLRWDRFTAGNTADFVQVRLEDSAGKKVFETPDLGKSGALNGFAFFTWIPPGTLSPGKTYTATLLFQKNVSRTTTAYPGALGLAFYFTRTTFPLVTTSEAKPDVEDYLVSKGTSHEQTDLYTLVPEKKKEFVFNAKVNGAGAGFVLSSTLTTPLGNTIPLVASGRDFEFEDFAVSGEALDAKYPVGNYTHNFNLLHDGVQQPSINFIFCPYLPAPRLNSFDPSQEVRAEADIRIAWDSWYEGTFYDFIQVRIEDDDDNVVFETDDFGDKDALDGRATSVVVPAGTLKPGESYKARIVFNKLVAIDTSAYRGSLGFATYFARTKFDINTAPADVKTFSVAKGLEFVQNSSSGPQLQASAPYVFLASVVMERSNSVLSASVTTPLGATHPLVYQGDGETWLFGDSNNNQSIIDTTYPDGNYTLSIQTANQGTKTLQLPISGALYPNSPRISNYSAAQSIDSGKSFTLRWDAFVGGTTNDFIYAAVKDSSGATVDDSKRLSSSSALKGTDTSYKIGSATLLAGISYTGSVSFEKLHAVNRNTYPGAVGYSGLFARTTFRMATLGGGNPPAFLRSVVNAEGKMETTFTSMAGVTYQIETSENLQNWAPAATITASGSETTWIDPSLHPKCYYRVVAGQ